MSFRAERGILPTEYSCRLHLRTARRATPCCLYQQTVLYLAELECRGRDRLSRQVLFRNSLSYLYDFFDRNLPGLSIRGLLVGPAIVASLTGLGRALTANG
jgi:hypothetical protein